MEVLFTGTGAADWPIELYDQMPEFRRNSGVLIDSDLLIDPGPHIYHFAEKNNNSHLFDNVENIIVTHTHSDHFNAENVLKLSQNSRCVLWGDSACLRNLEKNLGSAASAIKFRETKIGQTYEIGKYKITPLRANHVSQDPQDIARIYIIEKDGRILYYGCDTSWIPTESWNFMKDLKINAMIMELTCGLNAPDDWRIFEHTTIEMLKLMLAMFRKYDRFDKNVRFYVSHMARTLHTNHEELKNYLAEYGVTPAYDGMKINV